MTTFSQKYRIVIALHHHCMIQSLNIITPIMHRHSISSPHITTSHPSYIITQHHHSTSSHPTQGRCACPPPPPPRGRAAPPRRAGLRERVRRTHQRRSRRMRLHGEVPLLFFSFCFFPPIGCLLGTILLFHC